MSKKKETEKADSTDKPPGLGKTISVRFPLDLQRDLEAIAANMGLTVGDVIKMICHQNRGRYLTQGEIR